MSEQERREAFAAYVDALQKQLGVQVVLDVEHRKYGNMIQIVPVMRVEAVPNWTPSESKEGTLPEVKAVPASERVPDQSEDSD